MIEITKFLPATCGNNAPEYPWLGTTILVGRYELGTLVDLKEDMM